jgi:hypothetical protein
MGRVGGESVLQRDATAWRDRCSCQSATKSGQLIRMERVLVRRDGTTHATLEAMSALPPSGHGHAAKFYENDASLYRTVSRFLSEGLLDGQPAVGLPLVRELCEAMGAECRYERAPSGGARFMVAFKLAPTSAPSADDD